jgi:hypothetical protein
MVHGTAKATKERGARVDLAEDTDWTKALPQNRVKALLQENPHVSVLPRQTLDFITAVSGLFVRNLIQDARNIESGVIDERNIRQVVTTQPQYAFLSKALKEFLAQSKETSSSHLFENRKRIKSRSSLGRSKEDKSSDSKKAKLSAADSLLAQEAEAVLEADNSGQTSALDAQIEVDDEDYD